MYKTHALITQDLGRWPARQAKEADAYQVAGVESDAKAADIKKRYWRLSLMIHPDKCDHPRAQDAFHAVSQAAKDLQVRHFLLQAGG